MIQMRPLPAALLALGLWAACATQGPAVRPSGPAPTPRPHDRSARDPAAAPPSTSSEAPQKDPPAEIDPAVLAEEEVSSPLDGGVPDAGEAPLLDAAADAGLADAGGDVTPAGPSPEVVARGRRIYRDVCMLCHDIRHRLPGLGYNPARMKRRIRRGGKRMPAIPPQELSQRRLHALFAYLREIGAVR